ncbi:MAG: methylenetetrahydrofolate--tRNA-(uracil(54)-C(5))-methyltransferase (FADH(2)-oxidizing) TrmFO [Ruminococcaceae bacterium]|nr:methylenetetrahydrofolate--tRNA-(uracil(54)-C(5))-methyltransferase (FADH(2)-oxidizing) TrmFO [Oscillospiraceae bacterium]
MKKAIVIGAGLAGCEAAWRLANENIQVTLYEMKPKKKTPAHKSENFCELVCSNSLRGASLSNAVGLLKEEMRRIGSLIMEAADKTAVPAGGALAVDRNAFSKYVTDKIRNHKNITVIEKEIRILDSYIDKCDILIIASGPLTSTSLSKSISKLIGEDYLHFFDAAAPIVMRDSIDMNSAYFASRYDKGTPDYINCPMNEEEYNLFYDELINAKSAELHSFDKKLKVFEGCMPVEIMAKRGRQTLLFGPLKPVGLKDPRTNKGPYAVVQLRQDNSIASLYNIVGFQTHLTFSEQKRVFSLIPALKDAQFVRYGVMHKNTFLNSPKLLNNDYSLRANNKIYFAGQMTGVEGYVESAASGLVAGISASKRLTQGNFTPFSEYTAIGALAKYVSDSSIENFQPMNINFGLLPSLEKRIKGKKERYEAIAEIALEHLVL